MRVFLVLLYLYASYVIAQSKNETFDFKLAKELEHKRGVLLKEVYMKEGCRVYDIDFDKEEGGYIEESLPSPSFITRRKDYYPNGKIKSIKHFIGENVLIGKSVYYNKKGVKRIVDEDKKFKKIKYPYILQFLEKKGHINLKTGKGRIVDIRGTNYFGFELYSFNNFFIVFSVILFTIPFQPACMFAPTWLIGSYTIIGIQSAVAIIVAIFRCSNITASEYSTLFILAIVVLISV